MYQSAKCTPSFTCSLCKLIQIVSHVKNQKYRQTINCHIYLHVSMYLFIHLFIYLYLCTYLYQSMYLSVFRYLSKNHTLSLSPLMSYTATVLMLPPQSGVRQDVRRRSLSVPRTLSPLNLRQHVEW